MAYGRRDLVRRGTCTADTGSVAGITELNKFMEDWICPSMKNKTEYFW